MLASLRPAQMAGNPTDLDNPALWTPTGAGGRQTTAGEWVGEGDTLTIGAWYAGIRNLATDVAKLPSFAREEDERGDFTRLRKHSVSHMLQKRPNAYMTPIVARGMLLVWAMSNGNGYAEIERDSLMRPVAYHPIHPQRVKPYFDADGRLKYEVMNGPRQDRIFPVIGGKGSTVVIDADNMLHVRALIGDSVQGMPVYKAAAESLGLTIAAERFGAAFFANSGSLSAVIKHPDVVASDQAARDSFAVEFDRKYKGARKSGGWLLLEQGMDYVQMGIPPENAQFLETRQWQVEEIARWLRIPPSKLMHLLKANFNTLEMQNTEYVQDCLQPWIVAFEQEAERKLLTTAERETTDIFHDVSELTRGDMKTQAEVSRVLFNVGAVNGNEIRRKMGMNGGGEEMEQRFVPGNMNPLRENMPIQAGGRGPSDPSGERDSIQQTPPEPLRMTAAQAQEMIAPVFRWAQLKADKRGAHLVKKHAEDAERLDAELRALYRSLGEEIIEQGAGVIATVSGLCGTDSGLSLRFISWCMGGTATAEKIHLNELARYIAAELTGRKNEYRIAA